MGGCAAQSQIDSDWRASTSGRSSGMTLAVAPTATRATAIRRADRSPSPTSSSPTWASSERGEHPGFHRGGPSGENTDDPAQDPFRSSYWPPSPWPSVSPPKPRRTAPTSPPGTAIMVDPQLYFTQLLVSLLQIKISGLPTWLPDQWKLRQAERLAALQSTSPLLP